MWSAHSVRATSALVPTHGGFRPGVEKSLDMARTSARSTLPCRDLREDRFGVLCRELLGFDRVVHGAELGAAHRTEGCILESFFGQRLVVICLRGFRVERQLELLLPVESEARAR